MVVSNSPRSFSDIRAVQEGRISRHHSAVHKPFATGGDPNAQRFDVEGVVASGMTDDRQKSRQELLGKMNTFGDRIRDLAEISAAEDAKKRAYELILGAGREVFDLSKEKPALRDRYGR